MVRVFTEREGTSLRTVYGKDARSWTAVPVVQVQAAVSQESDHSLMLQQLAQGSAEGENGGGENGGGGGENGGGGSENDNDGEGDGGGANGGDGAGQ